MASKSNSDAGNAWTKIEEEQIIDALEKKTRSGCSYHYANFQLAIPTLLQDISPRLSSGFTKCGGQKRTCEYHRLEALAFVNRRVALLALADWAEEQTKDLMLRETSQQVQYRIKKL